MSAPQAFCEAQSFPQKLALQLSLYKVNSHKSGTNEVYLSE